MLVLRKEKKLCFSCMEEHEVQIVKIEEKSIFKGEEVKFEAECEYCENTDEFLANEEQIKRNDLALKDAYREKIGLLTSARIKIIREKYKISQKQFSEVLGWGTATIIRYENHQVQDRAHDDILRKIESDPKWFLEMLDRAKEEIKQKYFIKYYKVAIEQLGKIENPYISTINDIKYNFDTIRFDMDGATTHFEQNYLSNSMVSESSAEYGVYNELPKIVLAA